MQSSPSPGRPRAGAILLIGTLLLAASSGGTPSTTAVSATTPASPDTDPTGPATGTTKVEKGGWWGSNEFVARSAYRHYEDPPTYGDKHIGFRVASQ